ncbi:MAG: hypothetical protein Q7U87_01860 [bacterium]|nr:hypothetical protein [bacterium]
MKTILHITIILGLVFSFLLGCASTTKLEKQMLSENDSIRVEALCKFDDNLSWDKQLIIVRSLINRAKYGKPKDSFLALECLAHSKKYALEFSGQINRGIQTKYGLEMDKLTEILHTVDGPSIQNIMAAIEKGSPETKIFCIDVIGLSKPIYVDAVEYLIKILNNKWDNPYSKRDYRNSEWEDPSYHAYQALKRIGTLEALDATIKYDSKYKNIQRSVIKRD